MLTLCWPNLTLSYPYVDPRFAYVALPIANPHSSDRKGGGGEGVGTGFRRAGSAAGAATLITFGYQPKASGKDTGLVAGARI